MFNTRAGKWGAFGQCDLPLRTIDAVLEAGATMKPDLVLVSYTNDPLCYILIIKTLVLVTTSLLVN